jgi:hypothetical protein
VVQRLKVKRENSKLRDEVLMCISNLLVLVVLEARNLFLKGVVLVVADWEVGARRAKPGEPFT